MVVLPFVVDDISYDLSLSFKNLKKEEKVLKPEKKKIEAGSIEIGKTKLVLPIDNSYYFNVPQELTRRIRQETNYEGVDFIKVTGKNYSGSDFYDVYTIPSPPNTTNGAIDYLYGILVNDLRLKGKEDKTTVLSFEDCGILSLMDPEIVKKIEFIKNNSINKEHFYSMLYDNNLDFALSFIEFFNTLRIEAVEDSIRSYKDLKDLTTTFQTSNNKIKKELDRYLKISEKNVTCFLTLSSIKEQILDEPLFLPMFTTANNTSKVYYKDAT